MNVINFRPRPKNDYVETILSYPANVIANELIGQGIKDLSPMKLQKLIYFANGWCLALTGFPLVNEKIEAWEYGPVIPKIYSTFRRFNNSPVSKVNTDEGVMVDLDTRKLIEMVTKRYGDYSALELSDMTHVEGSPWHLAWLKGRNSKLEDREIESHFRSFLKNV